jgi:Tfp pilus assembly protein PilN
MIEINLLPPQLKKKRKAVALVANTIVLPRETVIALVGGLVFFLIFIHAVLQFVIAIKFVQIKRYESQTAKLSQDKASVDRVLQQLRSLQAKVKSIEGVAEQRKVLWAKKLNAISDAMPHGVWLTRLTFQDGLLIIQGSSVSKSKNEMSSVHTFTANLKNQPGFTENLGIVELGLIKSRKINTTQIADFTITADVPSAQPPAKTEKK